MIKGTFGMHSHLLRINSLAKPLTSQQAPPHMWPWYNVTGIVPPSSTSSSSSSSSSRLSSGEGGSGGAQEVHVGHFLSDEDVKGIATFVRDMATQSLLPHMENSVTALNEQVAASRRGLTGRLFSAGRKYFSSGSTAASKPSMTTGPNAQPMYACSSLFSYKRRPVSYVGGDLPS